MTLEIRIKERVVKEHEEIEEVYTPESIRRLWSDDTAESCLVLALLEKWESAERRANWHEAAHNAGKTKLIEAAVDKATADLRQQLAATTSQRDALLDEVEAAKQAALMAIRLNACNECNGVNSRRSYAERSRCLADNLRAAAVEEMRMRAVETRIGARVP